MCNQYTFDLGPGMAVLTTGRVCGPSTVEVAADATAAATPRDERTTSAAAPGLIIRIVHTT